MTPLSFPVFRTCGALHSFHNVWWCWWWYILELKADVVGTMSTSQLSSSKHDDFNEDLRSVDTWDPQPGGAFSFSISSRSIMGTPQGLSAKQKAVQQERSTLGVKETRAILCLRWMVLLTLVMFGVSFALTLFYVVKDMQEDDFINQFGFYKDQVIEKFNRQLERKLNSMDTLSTDMTSFANASGSEFPFVTFPNFEFRGANARISGDSVFIFYMPYITEDMKVPWETYAAANRADTGIAYGSAAEQEIKAAQDEMFGLQPPEIDGMALDYTALLDSLFAEGGPGYDTSIIWSFRFDGKLVS